MKKSKYKRAVCLSYDAGNDAAPEILANGQELLADEVVKIARKYGVPVIDDPVLARALSQFEELDEIPEELYEAVAILLSKVQDAARE